ncbi:hypothetical protein SAMN06272771_0085 [Streptomyces sp. Ag82_O1-12]|uniref:hypothetical protein n=1 Tax=unclassified Streptomyces TaxID=2593676 RepID=UPI000BCB338B|nr:MULTISPECIES: hypothetical protein [unclassified Streptomyces]SMQ13812.1 hypothetical protein SAMN06272771_0085 [Streptomyces sp. Ag82_O1-12]SOD42842.1 hypothetical protein SAMN06272727_0075 [Streptomyces sp. Ag82_G6-1]
MPPSAARNWVKAFGTAAKRDVTADFYDEGSVRQVVVLYFAKSGQVKEIEALTATFPAPPLEDRTPTNRGAVLRTVFSPLIGGVRGDRRRSWRAAKAVEVRGSVTAAATGRRRGRA